jgi:hypothetical protein
VIRHRSRRDHVDRSALARPELDRHDHDRNPTSVAPFVLDLMNALEPTG